jgi:hypothetical protein
VIWAGRWSKKRIEAARLAARIAKKEYVYLIAQSESQLTPAHDDQKPNPAAEANKLPRQLKNRSGS